MLCKSLLNGALINGLPAAITDFSTQVKLISQNVLNASKEQLNAFRRCVAELFIVTMGYIQPKLRIVHRNGLEILLQEI